MEDCHSLIIKGSLKILPSHVHVNDNCLGIILSLKYMNNIPHVQVTMETSIYKAVHVILKDGIVFKFKECGSGLYFYDMASTDDQNSAKTNSTIAS